MDRKSALIAAALALAAGAATAQSITFNATNSVPFSRLFDPDGGVFAPGAFTTGSEGSFMANTGGSFTLTYLGQESAFSDGIRVGVGGSQLTELNHVGDSITGAMTAGTALNFTFFGSDGMSVTNGVIPPDMNPSFALLGTNVVTNRGTFQYIVGYNDSANHDDWDDFVVGINVAPVPEPQTYALLLAGLGAIGFVARRRQSS
jgi:hypothetical protein